MPKIVLEGSVGKGGQNREQDVLKVQSRLAELGFNWVEPDGDIGPITIRTIRLFQAMKNGTHTVEGSSLNDGRIDVGGGTHTWLQARNAPRWQRFPDGSVGEGFQKHVDGDQHDFGSEWLASTIVAAAARYRDNFLSSHAGKALIAVNDVSLPRGGDSPHHAGHETGLDADLRLPKKDGKSGGITHNSVEYDRESARAMLVALRAQPLVVRLRFNDPTLIAEGLCVFTAGHDNHIHVDIGAPLADKDD